ncbi:TPA: hypothetical protein J8J51_001431 [Enterococcus faecalis]|uniref:hypothetical protein n=1 Tax=Enterococcus faecalis TaxID=1351 RepID=UPI000B618FD5|nr:hypothetical protein [Enterococcus faecalis]ASE66485.1 hypothetical protein CEQ16_12260 [Enterococcus faecalis]HAZ6595682.1 hypothetical protein [Enterococcus faecalis]
MNISDWIQLIAICISLIVAVISILQTNKSIRITEKSIKDANRPYLSIYCETIDTIYFSKHLVLKNFGNTSAKILNITSEGIPNSLKREIDFSSLIQGYIAPQQKFTTSIDDDFIETIYFEITYQDLDSTVYTELFSVKTDMSNTLIWSAKTLPKDSCEATAIKLATHAIIKSFK